MRQLEVYSFDFIFLQDGLTPLYVACQMGHKVIVDILLENGADIHLATVSILTRGFG